MFILGVEFFMIARVPRSLHPYVACWEGKNMCPYSGHLEDGLKWILSFSGPLMQCVLFRKGVEFGGSVRQSSLGYLSDR